MSGRLLATAAALLLSVGVTGGCAQPPLESEGFAALTPSTSPTYGVATSDLHTVDLAALVREDPRIPTWLRELLRDCPDCLAAKTTWVDATGDGREDAVIDLGQDGLSFATIIYGVKEGRATPVFIHLGRHGRVAFTDHELVLTRPMYATTDSECCPSGAPLVSRFRWDGERFVQTSRTGGGAGFSTFDPDDKVIT